MHQIKLPKGVVAVRMQDGKVLVAPTEVWVGCLLDCLPAEAREILLERVVERMTAARESRIVVPT